MKTFEIVVFVTTDDSVNEGDIALLESDVIDGFEITRREGDITNEFLLKSAYIESCKESTE